MHTQMAKFLGLLCTFLAILAAASLVTAHREFRVGDSEGWRLPPLDETDLYTHWASKRRIHVGDSLRFRYKNDSVVVVDKWGYYHCNASNAISFYNDGNTLVKLDEPGPIYFMSGDGDHCKEGQKLGIDVIPLHPKSHSPPAPAPSPESSSGTSVSVAMLPVFVALIVSLVGLVLISMA